MAEVGINILQQLYTRRSVTWTDNSKWSTLGDLGYIASNRSQGLQILKVAITNLRMHLRFLPPTVDLCSTGTI